MNDLAGKRILYVTTIAEFVRAFLLPYLDHYRSLGARVDVATHGAKTKGIPAHCDTAYDMQWSRSLSALPQLLAAAAGLRRILKNGGYDIVHVHTPIAAFCTRLVTATLPVPRPVVIYTAHGFHFHSRGRKLTNALWRIAETVAARWTDYLVVINEEDARYAEESGMVPRNRVVRMPGIGVDTERLQREIIPEEQVLAFRKSLKLQAEDRLFVMPAEFTANKRHEDAIRALARTGSHNHLAFAGDGPLRASMVELGRAVGVGDRVHFLGFRTDVPVCLRAGMAMILPSAREGLSRSILEAFCVGVPVIATDIRGNRDLVRNHGMLVPLGDVEGLAGAIRWVGDHPAQAAEMAQRAARFVAEFDIQRVIGLHDELYTKAIRDKEGALPALGPTQTTQ